jgi:serine phosphatase RsbU (regulator of sigma subunit)/pSer/pThr/pTyr-binding forkhead associated (FHA) protein
MTVAQIQVTENGVSRSVAIEKDTFTLGRREDNDLRLEQMDISRKHAEIVKDGDRWVLRDLESRFGVFINEVAIAREQELKDGDRIRLGPVTQVEMRFSTRPRGAGSWTTDTSVGGSAGDLRTMNTLLESLSALGSARVIDEVLAIVLDSAIKLSGAERGFVMLSGNNGELEFMQARGRGGVVLEGTGVETHKTSRQIPEKVFRHGKTEVVQDLLIDADVASEHRGTIQMGIRGAVCLPLRLSRASASAIAGGSAPRVIGVLYLDSKMKAALLSPVTIEALEALAGEAAVAIDNARLYRQEEEKNRLEKELDRAREMQVSLLPAGRHARAHFELAGVTAPCRAVGGDFFDYVDLDDGSIGFAVADISGKGPSAALMAAKLQGLFSSLVELETSPARILTQLNRSLVRRAISSRFATLTYGVLRPDGTLIASNGGHNPTFVLRADGSNAKLEKGGTLVGILPDATFEEEEFALAPGDMVVLYSDGVTEAEDSTGEMYGEERLLACLEASRGLPVEALRDAIHASVEEFAKNTAQADDITVLVVKYLGI